MYTTYDVFLSFGGGDTASGFADFLYNSLLADGIHVFKGDDALPIDEQISPGLLRDIKIAIPIISEQYAQSKWCLCELTKIMDCHRKQGKSVFPVFYKVEVLDIGRRRGNFEQALFEHERECSTEEVREWMEALMSVTKIRGWISPAMAKGHEGKLVKKVVAKVSSELNRMSIPMFIRSVYLYFSKKKRRESKCQVFLAFRGPDTRYNLAAYLYTSLVAAGVRVFNDDDPCLIGKDVTHEISNAIDQCKISIPILSKNYASSPWCLEDLAQMVECNRTKGQKILPIFYKVKASHVQDLSHLFGEYMLRHKELVDKSTYERWERALREVGSSKGWESDKIDNGHEGVLVKQVVEKVSGLLKSPQTLDPPSPSIE
ncbi:disease resistance protein TAO1-like [Syzygium oleosum]|uniref:disease resistance protein TAO1-like n=1 Tax=Syzygium oleosum TaxID=219896 RepID=UPI0011D1B2E4|nr:disease resistance protein TAO1-like [Syzygium oleosum]